MGSIVYTRIKYMLRVCDNKIYLGGTINGCI